MLSIFYVINILRYQYFTLSIFYVINILRYQYFTLSIFYVINILRYQYFTLSIFYVINIFIVFIVFSGYLLTAYVIIGIQHNYLFNVFVSVWYTQSSGFQISKSRLQKNNHLKHTFSYVSLNTYSLQ